MVSVKLIKYYNGFKWPNVFQLQFHELHFDVRQSMNVSHIGYKISLKRKVCVSLEEKSFNLRRVSQLEVLRLCQSLDGTERLNTVRLWKVHQNKCLKAPHSWCAKSFKTKALLTVRLTSEVSSLIWCGLVFEFLVHFFCCRNQKVNQDWGASRQLSLGSLLKTAAKSIKFIRHSKMNQKWTKTKPHQINELTSVELFVLSVAIFCYVFLC